MRDEFYIAKNPHILQFHPSYKVNPENLIDMVFPQVRNYWLFIHVILELQIRHLFNLNTYLVFGLFALCSLFPSH